MQVKESQLYIMKGENSSTYIAALFGNTSKLI
jgi:hypothetical protein